MTVKGKASDKCVNAYALFFFLMYTTSWRSGEMSCSVCLKMVYNYFAISPY